jgi:hypothetical protein
MAGMFRERTIVFPKEVDRMLENLYAKHLKHRYGSFDSMNTFLCYLIDLGARKDEYDMDRAIAPSIVLPSLETKRPQQLTV